VAGVPDDAPEVDRKTRRGPEWESGTGRWVSSSGGTSGEGLIVSIIFILAEFFAVHSAAVWIRALMLRQAKAIVQPDRWPRRPRRRIHESAHH
jgi:hypothetical protein